MTKGKSDFAKGLDSLKFMFGRTRHKNVLKSRRSTMKLQPKFAFSFLAGILSVGVIGTAAHAQQSGLVNVDLSDVSVEIADDLDVNVSQIPVTVQAPIGVAANVCDVTVEALVAEAQDTGTATCEATNTSTALNQVVQRQISLQ
jgi:hypothetical protein